MVKLFILVLLYIYYIIETSGAPIIKSSGVQWSEPRGTGKGNITLLVIPQNRSNSNDSDMIVAVKSDYQIVSQDTQLLNLVVNEQQHDKTNGLKTEEILEKCENLEECRKQKDKIKDLNIAKYFVTENTFPPVGISSTIIIDDINYITFREIPTTLNYSTINSFTTFNTTYFNDEKIYSENIENNPNVTLSNNNFINTYTSLNVTETVRENILENKTEMTIVTNGSSSDITFDTINSNDTFLNEALNVLKKLKQDPLYYNNNIKNNGNIMNINKEFKEKGATLFDSIPKNLKEEDLVLASDDGEVLSREYEHSGIYKNDHSNFESDLENNNYSGTTCPPYLTVEHIHAEQLASTRDTVTEQSTLELPGSISTPTTINERSDTSSFFNLSKLNNEWTHEIISVRPTAKGKMEEVTNITDDQFTIPSSTKDCKKIVIPCSSTSQSDDFELISHMVDGEDETTEHTSVTTEMTLPTTKTTLHSSEITFPKLEMTSSDTSTPEMRTSSLTTFLTECFVVSSNKFKLDTVRPTLQAAKAAPLKKITLEPQMSCETLLKVKDHNNSITFRDYDAHLYKKEVTLPLHENGAFLTNKEIYKRKNIPKERNTSLNELGVNDLEGKDDHVYGKVAKLYNNIPLMFHINDKMLTHTSSMPFLNNRKINDKVKIVFENSNLESDKILTCDKNKILKMHFGGRNIVEQKPSYQSDKHINHFEYTPKINSDYSYYKMKQGDENPKSQLVIPGIVPKKSISIIQQQGDNVNVQSKNNLQVIITEKQLDLTQQILDEENLQPTLNPLQKVSNMLDTENSEDSLLTTHNTADARSLFLDYDVNNDLHLEIDCLNETTTKMTVYGMRGYNDESIESELSMIRKTTKYTSSKDVPEMGESTDENSQRQLNLFDEITVKTTTMCTPNQNTVDEQYIKSQYIMQDKNNTKSDLSQQTGDSFERSKTIEISQDKCITEKTNYINHNRAEGNTNIFYTQKFTRKPQSNEKYFTQKNGHYTVKQSHNLLFNKTIHIPCNSVNKFIIQIMRNTEIPGKLDDSRSNNDKKYGHFLTDSVGKDLHQEKLNYISHKDLPKKVRVKNYRVESSDTKLHSSPQNIQDRISSKNNKKMKSVERASLENTLSIDENKSLLQENVQLEKLKQSNILTKPVINTAHYKERGFLSNVLKIPKYDKSEIKKSVN